MEEITLVLDRERIKIRSYFDNAKSDDLSKKSLLTELVLTPNDCDSYEFNGEGKVELTFCLKEMKVCDFCSLFQFILSLTV